MQKARSSMLLGKTEEREGEVGGQIWEKRRGLRPSKQGHFGRGDWAN